MIANFFASIFSGLWLYLMLIGAGLAIGAGAYVVGRFTGLLGAAVFGAVAILAAYTGGLADQFSDNAAKTEIARLEAIIELKNREIAAADATKKILDETLSDLSDTLEHNNAVIAEMETKLASIPPNPECDLPEEIFDALQDLR